MLIFVTVGLLTMALVIVTALSTNKVNLIGKINIIKTENNSFKVIVLTSDISIPTTLMIHQGVSHHYIKCMPGKNARTIIISMSLLAGFMFGYIYKETLISSLVSTEMEQPIDSMQDLLKSSLNLYYPLNTAVSRALEDDPREEVKHIMKNRAIGFPFFGVHPSYIHDL